MTQTIDLNTTMGELARTYPVLIPFFHEKGVDYCCGGKDSISQICAVNNWASQGFLAEVAERIEADGNEPVPTWEPGSESALIAYILERFHEGHRRDFKSAQSLMTKVLKVHGKKGPVISELAGLLQQLIEDIEPHMQKEEQVLFPMILAKLEQTSNEQQTGFATPHAPIRVMLMEHENVGHLLDTLVAKSNEFTPPDWACTTVKGLYELLKKLNQDIRLHVHLENNVLFPMVLALDW